jgi:hypothetical protein
VCCQYEDYTNKTLLHIKNENSFLGLACDWDQNLRVREHMTAEKGRQRSVCVVKGLVQKETGSQIEKKKNILICEPRIRKNS